MTNEPKWKPENFASFWKHYELSQAWIGVNKNARNIAIRDIEWRKAEDEINAMLNALHASSPRGRGIFFFRSAARGLFFLIEKI